ncbi:efflux RND transporter periplasmic adaptor subunit [Hydrocarboniclastica marina]|uniref:HlyD family efflux transporter periplasmic adaptor subunit n=1 Tax=Hydrocarboniclastica marina TaxID=2259620 RepID=A0A4P7XF61_9ALTE|nr:HlyD family efflux transporter periplasmic adaptor subunit [Hydrocarboniclastica marina]QCF25044.1 HlyD family efflux transporter periplasmic adaptor subunit [Hydrocarboniclastica marina]
MAVNSSARSALTTAAKHLIRSPAILILAVTVLIIAALMLLRPQAPRVPAEEQSFPVQVRQVVLQDINPQLRLLGQVESPRVSTLTASINAEVLSVPALEGARIPAGDLLVGLDPQDAELRLRQAQAELSNLEAQRLQEQNRARFDRETLAQQEALVGAAQRTVEREQRLRDSNLTSEARLDDARASLARAELNLISQRLVIANKEARLEALESQRARAEALRDQARLDLDRASVEAPFDAVVTAVQVSPGERVRPGDPLVTVYPGSALQVRAQVPQRWLGIIRSALADSGQLQAFSTIGNERHLFALARLSGQVNPGAGGVDALFRPTQTTPDTSLVLGQTLDIILELPVAEDVIAVPVAALYGTRQMFKVVDGRLASVQVEILGDRYATTGQQLLVRSDALGTGDQVVTTQIPNAVEGLKVELRQTDVDAQDDATSSSEEKDNALSDTRKSLP